MAAKRNKKDEEAVKAQAAEEQANVEEQTDAPVEPQAEETTENVEDAPINADEMAAAIKVGGNSYQQYARQMFKERLEENR